ncbi:hypothetical protein L6452_13923 [Arctium lappa]|uniref:Uncharacterized protein n=1 Tax=Arctium lappa TaxID=4217 RepID=A0ACB9CJI5_ARCLA|nr:hypothetical protein L6452_13923 [Arctium lappa]
MFESSIVGFQLSPPPKSFEDQTNSKLKHTRAGIISMTNVDLNTNVGRFFIALAPKQSFDGSFQTTVLPHQISLLMIRYLNLRRL